MKEDSKEINYSKMNEHTPNGRVALFVTRRDGVGCYPFLTPMLFFRGYPRAAELTS
jgi:hypothetical protein